MLLSAIKVFSWLFPFLKEIFITKSNANKKKPTSPLKSVWLKKLIIAVGLMSFILMFIIGREYIKLRQEFAVFREKRQDAPAQPPIKTKPVPDPTPPNPKAREVIDEGDLPPRPDLYPKQRKPKSTPPHKETQHPSPVDPTFSRLREINHMDRVETGDQP